MLRQAAKPVVFAIGGSAPVLARRLKRVRDAGVATILNLHRVAPHDRSAYPPLDPALFEELLEFVGHEFSVVPLAGLQCPSAKPKLVLSFDDGYRDFIEYALPAMRRRGFKPNQNVIPQCLESGLPPLNVMVQDFIGQAPAAVSAALEVPGFTGPSTNNLAAELSDFIRYSRADHQDLLHDALVRQLFAWEPFKPTPMMSPADVRDTSNWVEYGAHSYSHASMGLESEAYLRSDVAMCRTYFTEQLAVPMTIYAFPNGSFSAGQIDVVQSMGIDHVLLVGEAFDDGSAVHHRFTFDAYGSAEVRFKACGGFIAP